MSMPAPDLEHRAIDRALAEVEFYAERRAFHRAEQAFAAFRQLLEKHLNEEETLIYPAFAKRTGDPNRVLPFVQGQHRELQELIAAMERSLSVADHTLFETQLEQLEHLIKVHHDTEERLLPDEALTEASDEPASGH